MKHMVELYLLLVGPAMQILLHVCWHVPYMITKWNNISLLMSDPEDNIYLKQTYCIKMVRVLTKIEIACLLFVMDILTYILSHISQEERKKISQLRSRATYNVAWLKCHVMININRTIRQNIKTRLYSDEGRRLGEIVLTRM